MALSKSKSEQKTDQSTNLTNQQVGASEGSFAVGANNQGNVSVESVDADVIEKVTQANAETTGRAFDTVDTLAQGQNEVTKKVTEDVLTASSANLDRSLDFGESALSTVERATSEANQLLSNAYETYAGNLQRNAGVDDSTLAADAQRNQLIIGGIALVGVLLFSLKGKKS